MSFGLNLVTVKKARRNVICIRRPQLQGSGPWANLGAPIWAPSPLIGDSGLGSFRFGNYPETGYLLNRGGSSRASHHSQAYQVFRMRPFNTPSRGGQVPAVRDPDASNEDERENGPLALPEDVEEIPLDFSSTGQYGHEVAAAVEGQEARRSPSPLACEAPPPPPISDDDVPVPMDLSSQKDEDNSNDFDKVDGVGEDNSGDPDAEPKSIDDKIDDLKATISELKEKLERSRDDYSKKVFQMEKYSMGETTALLKAIYWKGQLHMEYDDLSVKHIVVRMKSMLYWDEDFNGKGSLLDKFREELKGKGNRDCVSIKRKWTRIFKVIDKKPHDFFQKNVHLHKLVDEEKMFLIKLAKACCVLKGIDISAQNNPQRSNAPDSQSQRPRLNEPLTPAPPSSVGNGNPFVDEEDHLNGWRDMPVFTSRDWTRSRLN